MPTVSGFASTNAVVTTGWTNPTNAYADDGTYATTTIAAKNTVVSTRYGGFGVQGSVPSTATINSVTIEVQYKVSTNGSIARLDVQGEWPSGTLRGTQTQDTAEPLTDAVVTQTVSGVAAWSDLADGTLFARVVADQGNSATSCTYSLDYVKATVDYTLLTQDAAQSGRPHSEHVFYAAGSARWWKLYVDQSATTTLKAAWSTDAVAWTDAAATHTMSQAVTTGFNLAAAYKSISGTDVVHIAYAKRVSSTSHRSYHVRATLSGTTITFGTSAEVTPASTATDGGDFTSGLAVAIDAANTVYHASSYVEAVSGWGNAHVAASSNADTGAAWTAGFAAPVKVVSPSQAVGSACLFSLGSGVLLGLFDNGAALTTGTDITWSKLSGGTWTPSLPPGNVFGSASSQDKNDWAACLRTTSDVHAVRRTGANTYEHDRFNGTDWTTLSGSAVPTQNSKAAGGLFLASDGSLVYLFVIDSDAANTVRYSAWTSGAGWSAWSALETSTQTRTALSGYRTAADGKVTLIWSEDTGSGNFGNVTKPLTVAGPAVSGAAQTGQRLIGQVASAVPRTGAAAAGQRSTTIGGITNVGGGYLGGGYLGGYGAAPQKGGVGAALGPSRVAGTAAGNRPGGVPSGAAGSGQRIAGASTGRKAAASPAGAAQRTSGAAVAAKAVTAAAAVPQRSSSQSTAARAVTAAGGSGQRSSGLAAAAKKATGVAVGTQRHADTATAARASVGAAVGIQRSAGVATRAPAGPAGAATGTQRATGVAAGIRGAAGAASGPQRSTDAATGAKRAGGVASGPTRTASRATAAKAVTAASVGGQRTTSIAGRFVPPSAASQGGLRTTGSTTGTKKTTADTSSRSRMVGATSATHRTSGAAQGPQRPAGATASAKAARGAAVGAVRTHGLAGFTTVPPPRWVEGDTSGSGLVEGATDGSGQVEGVLVGAGMVEGSSSL